MIKAQTYKSISL